MKSLALAIGYIVCALIAFKLIGLAWFVLASTYQLW